MPTNIWHIPFITLLAFDANLHPNQILCFSCVGCLGGAIKRFHKFRCDKWPWKRNQPTFVRLYLKVALKYNLWCDECSHVFCLINDNVSYMQKHNCNDLHFCGYHFTYNCLLEMGSKKWMVLKLNVDYMHYVVALLEKWSYNTPLTTVRCLRDLRVEINDVLHCQVTSQNYNQH
jgi:hypothetical protein